MPPGKQAYHNSVIYGIEILSNIKFEVPEIISGTGLCLCQSLARTFVFPARVRIINRIRFQYRLENIHDRMMQHPLRKRSRADMSRLGIPDIEKTVMTDIRFISQQLFSELPNIGFEILSENNDFLPVLLTFGGFAEGQTKIFRGRNQTVQAALSFHFSVPAFPFRREFQVPSGCLFYLSLSVPRI